MQSVQALEASCAAGMGGVDVDCAGGFEGDVVGEDEEEEVGAGFGGEVLFYCGVEERVRWGCGGGCGGQWRGEFC